MKTSTRPALLLASVAMLVCATVAQAQFTTSTNAGQIAITGYTGPGGAVTIPDTTNGLPITSIADYAFSYCTILTDVTIPNSVTNIADYAFGNCTSLTNVTLGAGVATVGPHAFEYCTGLTIITIPNSVARIADYAFWYCSGLTNVTIGSGVATVGPHAFEGCINLAIITIPNSVTNIADYAFWYCSGLTNVTIGSGVTTIGPHAFEFCTGLTTITVDGNNSTFSSMEGVLFNKNQTTLLNCPEGKTGNYTIPASVISIVDKAFYYCSGLTNVTIGAGVSSIAGYAFGRCSSLTTITVNASNSFFSSGSGVLFNKNQTTLLNCPEGKTGNCTIPGSVTAIADKAFYYCSSLTGVTIGSSVTTIGAEAFAFCSALKSVTIPNNVTSIGDKAFSTCTSLTSVYFHGNAPSLGWFVFFSDTHSVYYLPGKTGWGSPTFGGRPAFLWDPHAKNDASFGVRTNRFGFTIAGTNTMAVVVMACTNLVQPVWLPVATNTLNNGSSYFSDAQWTNHPVRFYGFSFP